MANKYKKAIKAAEEYLDAVEIVEVLEGAKSKKYTRRDISEPMVERAYEVLRDSTMTRMLIAKELIKTKSKLGC